MSDHTRDIIFKIFAVLAAIALCYHAAASVQALDDTPVWRHIIFIGVCTVCMYGFVKRPGWFIWFFGALTVQQLYSHGSHAIQLLKVNTINTVDIAVVILVPLAFMLLLAVRKAKA